MVHRRPEDFMVSVFCSDFLFHVLTRSGASFVHMHILTRLGIPNTVNMVDNQKTMPANKTFHAVSLTARRSLLARHCQMPYAIEYFQKF